MNLPTIERLAELQQMIADFAKIERVLTLADTERLENDVEHSFGLAITCWYLQPKIAPDLDVTKILKYALAHDIAELHAGDTYIFDEEAVAAKDHREQQALTQIQHYWPDFTELTRFAADYMNKADEEAKFVKAVDKMLPVLMIELGIPHRNIWKERKVTFDMIRDNKTSMHVSRYISPYYQSLIDWLEQRGNLPKG